MRLEMTMSDSGPVPRSHSPLVVVSSSRFIRGFLLSQEVSDPGSFFVVLAVDGLLKPQTQGHQFSVPLAAGIEVVRRLADMADGAMNASQQRFQGGAENVVIVGATEPPVG